MYAIRSYYDISISIYHTDLYSTSNKIRLFSILIAIIGIAIFAFITRLIIESVIKSIRNGINITQSIAKGNLDEEIHDAKTKDEVADFIKALKSMNYKLNEVVNGIRNNAESVAESSKQISQDAEYLAESANEQAASVEEMSSSMEEISSNIANNA